MNVLLRRLLVMLLAILCATNCVILAFAEDQLPAAPVKAVTIEFHEAITPLSGALLTRRFKQAEANGAKIIVIDIDSPGGYVSTTLELVDLFESSPNVTTVAYIQREAISGAALLALATDKIAIGPQALIGDAGMIMMGEDAAFRYVPEKERSYLAQRVRTIAEKSGRPASLAEAMVDKDLVVFKAVNKADGKVAYFSEREWNSMEDTDSWDKGKPVRESGERTFLTATGARAVELGLADYVVDDAKQLPEVIGAIAPIPVLQASWVDTLVLILNSSFITGLLLVIGLVALVIEFSAPGIGLGGLVSILCFGLFFWSRFLGGTSDWFEVILFLIGLSFVLLEIFVIPGFGVAGFSGVALMIFTLVLASRRALMPESSEDTNNLMIDVLTVLASIIGFMVVIGFAGKYLGELPLISRLALSPSVDDGNSLALTSTSTSNVGSFDPESLEIGTEGQAVGPLRPSGRMRIGNELVDVVTEGDYVDGDTLVKIIAKRGNRLVVRPV